MNFDSTEREPNMIVRLLAALMACAACFCIVFLPKGEIANYVVMSVCLMAAGLYFWSSADESGCHKDWKFSFFLGMIWFANATIHLLVQLALYLPKTE